MEASPLPLTGLRIASFEQFGAAPYATLFMAALGAEVLKIEAPETHGDYARQMGSDDLGPDDSLYFQAFNLNKKSICLDLKTKAGRRRFEEIVQSSSAVLNNLRGSVPKRLGLDYESLRSINPKIICAHISAYGRDNSRRDWPGYDFLMQAEAGFMSLTGEPGSPPTRIGLSMVDYMTGMTMAFAALGAIRSAEISGIGQDVDVSLFDVAIHQLAYQGTWHLNGGATTGRQPRSAHPSNVPCQLFQTSDGWVYVACMHEGFWQILAREVGHAEWLDDERFEKPADRLKNREKLGRLLDAVFKSRSSDAWVDLLRGKVPIAPVYDLEEALNSDFLLSEAKMIEHLPHPVADEIRVLANPIRLNGRRLPLKAAPALGADTGQVTSSEKSTA